MKLNKLNLCFLLVISLLLAATYRFGYLNIASTNYNSIPSGSGDLRQLDGMVGFSLATERPYVDGMIVYSLKNFYLPNEDRDTIEVVARCADEERRRLITLSDLAIAGPQVIELPEILDCQGAVMSIWFQRKEGITTTGNLRIDNQDYDPSPEVNTAPRIIYREYIRDIAKEWWCRLTADRIFSIFWLATTGLTVTAVLTLFLLWPFSGKRDIVPSVKKR